jgi:hypothetical protein
MNNSFLLVTETQLPIPLIGGCAAGSTVGLSQGYALYALAVSPFEKPTVNIAPIDAGQNAISSPALAPRSNCVTMGTA